MPKILSVDSRLDSNLLYGFLALYPSFLPNSIEELLFLWILAITIRKIVLQFFYANGIFIHKEVDCFAIKIAQKIVL
jgi:hypothetical protein